MNCPRKDIELLLHGPNAALQQHLRECAECRAAAEAQQTVWSALDEWPAPPVSGDFDRRLMARIAAEHSEPWWQRPWAAAAGAMHALSWKGSLTLAGACTVLLAVLLLRGPLADRGAVPAAQKSVDIDQVESALDDVDMLNQLGVAVPAQQPAQPRSGS